MINNLHKTRTITALLALFTLLLMPGLGWGQTNPTAQTLPYSQDFASLNTATVTTYPAGWQGWQVTTSAPTATGATAAPTADKTITASGTAASTSNGVYNFTGKLGFLSTGSVDNSIALALNTTGYNSVVVNFDAMTIRNPYDGSTNNIIEAIVLQYRVGTTGTFTNITYSPAAYQQNTTAQTSGTTGQQIVTGLNATLPIACNNQSVVQIRWIAKTVSGSAGSRASFAFDNISVTGTAMAAATKLAITSITPATPTSGSTFNVTVQAQDGSNVAGNVSAATEISLSTNGNAGTIGGTTTGTIAAGSSSVIINGVTLSGSGTNVTLTATRTSGDVLTDGTSVAFNVLAVAPTTLSTAMVFGEQTNTSIPLTSWTVGNGANRIVVRRVGGSATAPTNGTDYAVNATLGTGTVIYNGNSNTVTASGLTAGTQYTFDVYEYNGSGATANYGSVYTVSRYTLSTEPSAHSATFTATSLTSTTLTLNFTTTGTTGLGYIILRKEGTSASTGTPVDGTNYTVGNALGDGIITGFINANSITTLAQSGLTAATQYTFSIIPFSRVSTNTETYNYYTGGTIPTLTVSTVATAPTTPTTAITIGTKTPTSIPLTWTSGNGAGRIVVARLNSTSAVAPTAGTAYTANSTDFTDALSSLTGTGNRVVYNGTGNSVTVTGLTAATAYNFDVYEYNGTTGTYNYTAAASAGSTSTLAIEPTAQPTALTFTNITATGMTIGCTAGTGGSGRIFVVKAGSAVDFVPVDGTAYTANLNFSLGTGLGTNSDNKVVGVTGTSAVVTGLTSNTMYYVAVYELNGSSTTINYLTTSPLTGSKITTPAPATTMVTGLRTGTSINVSWTNGTGAGRIVVARLSATTAVPPTNGATYTPTSTDITDVNNPTTGTGNYVIYNGTGNSTGAVGLTSSTDYRFDVYEYSGTVYSAALTSGAISTLAVEPTAQTTAVTFSALSATGFTINFTKGNGTNRIVLVKSGSAVDANPVDATAYTASTTFTSGAEIGTGNRVVYNGTGASVTVTGLSASTTYHVAVFEFNGTGANTNYLLPSPATGSQLTLVTAPAAPTALTFASVTHNSFTASFTAPGATPAGYLVVRRKGAAVSETPVGGTVYTVGNSVGSVAANEVIYVGTTAWTNYAQTALTDNTTYYYAVYSYAGSGAQTNYSTVLTGNQTTMTIPVTLPYSQNFESTTTEWLLETTGTNKWAIGAATNNGGTKSLYISNDAGTTNAYTSTATNTVAYLNVDLSSVTSASLSFNWKSNGESGYDYGEVYLYNGSSTTLISGSKEFQGATTFTTKVISLTPYVGTTVQIQFIWVNDGSLAYQPPFAIDNISITSGDLPIVSTTAASSITVNNAISGGNVTNDGGSTVTRGVCWNTTGTPTIANSKTTDGTGTGVFTSALTGLVDNTLYYVRAYATNSTGTAYGNEVSFKTASVAAPTATAATSVGTATFNANWNAVPGASGGYLLDVSTSSTFGTGTPATLNEGFETGLTGGYTTGDLTLGSGVWSFVDAGLKVTGAGLFNSGLAACQMKASSGVVTSPALNNIGTVTFYAKASSGTTVMTIKKIVNSVTTTVTTRTVTNTWAQYSVPVNEYSTGVRIVFAIGSTYGYIDDIAIGYGFVPSFVTDYNPKAIAGQATVTSAVNTNLSSNTTYYYRLRAVGSNSNSANSNVITVTTLPTAPTISGFTPTSLCAGSNTVVTISGSNFIGTSSVKFNGVEANYSINNASELFANLPAGATTGKISVTTPGGTVLSTGDFTVNALVTPSVTIAASPGTTVANGTSVTFTPTPVNGGTPTYQWYKNTLPVSTAGTYTYVPANGDAVYVVMTSTLGCVTSATATSSTINMTVTVASASTFTGTGNWEDASKWSDGVPGATTNATINGTATVTDIAECNNCTISGTGALTINASTGLLVGGNLLIQSDGSLKHAAADLAVTGTTTVERAISDAASDKFHLFISPITSPVAATAGSCFEGAYIDEYLETPGKWNRLLTGANVMNDKGYAINFLAGTHTLVFQGALNTGAHTYTNLSYNTGAAEYPAGWHLLGNTYTCGINPALCSATNLLNSYVYVWDPSGSGNYATYSIGSATIPGTVAAMQGFFVKAEGASNGFSIPTTAKTIGGTFLKSSATVPDMLTLRIEGNGYSDKSYVLFNAEATSNFDMLYDAYKLDGLDEAPQLYSLLPGEKASVNTLPSVAATENIPLGLKVGKTATYTLTVAGTETFGPSVPIRLDDLKLGTTQDLRLNPVYTFTASPGDAENRLRLRFASATGIDDPKAQGISIFQSQGSVVVRQAGTAAGTVYVYSATGALVASQSLTPNETRLRQLAPGVYLVKVVTGKAAVSEKVVISQNR